MAGPREGADNLSGLWMGSFAYPGGAGPTTPFLARIEDHDGRLAGTTIEPDNIVGGQSLEAEIVGNRQGSAVDFTKTYGGLRGASLEPIDYVGRLSGDGNTVSGVWSLQMMNGTFEMHREAVWEEDSEAEEAVVAPLEAAEVSAP